jgi:hypothetical protein
MTAIPQWAHDPCWGDVTGTLVRFGVDRAEGVALGRLALTFDPVRRHDLIWIFKLRGTVTRMGSDPAANGDERIVKSALEKDWDVARGRIVQLPSSFTGGVEAYLWDVEVPLRHLPDGVDTSPYRENSLLPCRADLHNRRAVRGLPYTRPMRDQRPEQFIRALQPRGVHLTAALVQANNGLWQAGQETLPGCVLISFERLSGMMPYLHKLAERAGQVKSRQRVRNRDEQFVHDALWEGEKAAVFHRRYRLPRGFTGGPVVYMVDLWMYRPFLRNGKLGTVRQFPVLAEPGDQGGIELLPFRNPYAFDPPALDVLTVEVDEDDLPPLDVEPVDDED